MGFRMSAGDIDIRGANLRGTSLKGADLRFATNLTRRQLDEAVIDKANSLPDYLLLEK